MPRRPALRRPVRRRARCDDRRHRAARDGGGARPRPGRARLGRHRVHARVRRLPALRRPPRRPRRAPPRVRRRPAALRRRVARVRRSRPSGAVLLAGRALQGLGAALVAPSALALLTACIRRADRAPAPWRGGRPRRPAAGRAAGCSVGCSAACSDWRWVFLVNVPVCLAAAARRPAPAARVPRRARPHRPTSPARSSATAGLAALVLRAHAPARPRRSSLAAAAFALFAAVERRAADPLLPLAALRRPRVATPNLVALVLTATTTPPMLLCTLHAQDVLGLDPVAAGLLFPPFNLAVVAGSLGGPRVAAALGRHGAMAAGLAGRGRRRARAARDRARTPRRSRVLMAGFALMGGGLGVASVASTALGTEALDAAPPGRRLRADHHERAGRHRARAWRSSSRSPRPRAARPEARVDGYRIGFTAAAAIAAAAAGLLVFRLPGERLVPRARLRRRY